MIRSIELSRYLSHVRAIFAKYDVSVEDREAIERTFGTRCLYQILTESGPLYDEYLRQKRFP